MSVNILNIWRSEQWYFGYVNFTTFCHFNVIKFAWTLRRTNFSASDTDKCHSQAPKMNGHHTVITLFSLAASLDISVDFSGSPLYLLWKMWLYWLCQLPSFRGRKGQSETSIGGVHSYFCYILYRLLQKVSLGNGFVIPVYFYFHHKTAMISGKWVLFSPENNQHCEITWTQVSDKTCD